jgi:hypothetical protein
VNFVQTIRPSGAQFGKRSSAPLDERFVGEPPSSVIE